MVAKAVEPESEIGIQREFKKRIKVIDNLSDEELGSAVRNNLIKWWELKAWQKLREMRK